MQSWIWGHPADDPDPRANRADYPSPPASQVSTDSASEREGHFYDLSQFMVSSVENARERYIPLRDLLRFESLHRAKLDRGSIIWIKDHTKTRIDSRVMVVMNFNYPDSITCLSFCLRPELRRGSFQSPYAPVTGLREPNDGRVSMSPTLNAANNGFLPSLKVELYRESHDFTPQTNMSINCKVPYDVDCDVQVAVLGNMEQSSFNKLLRLARDLVFPLPEPEVAHRRPQAPSTTGRPFTSGENRTQPRPVRPSDSNSRHTSANESGGHSSNNSHSRRKPDDGRSWHGRDRSEKISLFRVLPTSKEYRD